MDTGNAKQVHVTSVFLDECFYYYYYLFLKFVNDIAAAFLFMLGTSKTLKYIYIFIYEE